MIPPRFEYHAPRSIGEAVALLGQLGSEAKLLAGGHSLLPMMKLRFAQPAHLIDINRIPELRGIREAGGTVVIGGIFEQTDSDDVTKVPFLGDVPYLGNLFKTRTKSSTRTEMLIFLTPKVLPDRTAGR